MQFPKLATEIITQGSVVKNQQEQSWYYLGRRGTSWLSRKFLDHLLPPTYQNYNYTQSNYLWEDPKTSRKDFLQLKTERRSCHETRRGRTQYCQDPHPWICNSQIRGILQSQKSSPRGPISHLSPWPVCPTPKIWAPITSGFENQQGLH